MRVKTILFATILLFSSIVQASFWSDVNSVAKSVVGYVYDVGAAVVSPVTNWLGRDSSGNNKQRHHKISGSSVGSNQGSNHSVAISSLQSQYNALSSQISRLEGQMANLSKSVGENRRNIEQNSIQLELQAKLIERNALKIKKVDAETKIIFEAEKAFNQSPAEVKKFLQARMEDINSTEDSTVSEHKLVVLHRVLMSALEHSQKELDKGIDLFPLSYQQDIHEILAEYQKGLLTLNFPSSDNLNLIIDETTISLIQAKRKSLKKTNNSWKQYALMENSKFKEEELNDIAAGGKSSKSLRDLLVRFKKEFLNKGDISNNLVFLQSMIMIEAKKLTYNESELENLEDVTNKAISESAKLLAKNETSFKSKIVDLDREEENYKKTQFQRDIIEPCLQLLSEKHPESLSYYYKTLFELTLYKIAWAYSNAVNDESKELEKILDRLLVDLEKEGVPSDYHANIKSRLEKNFFLQDIIDIQQKKHKAGKKKKYLLDERDQYAISRAKQFDREDYLSSILALVKHVYEDNKVELPENPQKALEKRISELIDNNKKYEQRLERAIGSIPSCQKLAFDISSCYVKNKNVGFSQIIKHVSELENAFLKKLENTYLPSLVNLEEERKEIVSKKEQRRSCETANGVVVTDSYAIAHSDINGFRYGALLQPEDTIYIDYNRPGTREFVPILNSQRVPVGWLDRVNVSFKNNEACFSYLKLID